MIAARQCMYVSLHVLMNEVYAHSHVCAILFFLLIDDNFAKFVHVSSMFPDDDKMGKTLFGKTILFYVIFLIVSLTEVFSIFSVCNSWLPLQ